MRRSRAAQRVLATLLFTDMVDSTTLATALGDTRWKDVQGRHHETMRRLLREHGGKELDTAGDGFFARFDDPASAIRCAVAASEALREVGLEIRAGVHVGQCEVLGSKLTGINVVVAARIMGLGTAGEVLISRTARDIVGGADIETREHGSHQLKGVDGMWDVLEVTSVDGHPRTEPLTREASIERLSEIEASATRRRRDLLVGALAIAVLLIVITGVAEARGHHTAIASAPADSIAKLDASSGDIVGVTPTGKGPRALVSTSAGLWVAETERSVVEFIGNDGTDQSIGMQCAPTSLAAADDGSVWVLCRSSNQLVRIDGSTQTADAPVYLNWPDGYTGLAIGGGTVWVTNPMHHTLERLDADTGASEGTPIPVNSDPTAIAVGGDAVWFLSGDQLFRLELTTGNHPKISAVGLRWPGQALAVGPDAVWVVHPAQDQVTRIDPSDLQQVGTITVGNQPQSIAVNADGAWVTNYLDGTVTEIPAAGATSTYAVGSGPYGIAADDGHVWVSMAGGA